MYIMTTLKTSPLNEALEYIESWLKFNFENSSIPGMQVAIGFEDDIVFSRAYGYADISKKEKMTNGHILRVASHSKTFTATAIMKLVENKKLKLDDKVSQYLPWFKSRSDVRIANVTIKQLLNHSAGIIRDGEDCDYWQTMREFPDQEELQKYITKAQLYYGPDVRLKYSNFGYGYLGLVIAAVTGTSYRDYVTANVVNKMKLKKTGPDLDAKSRKYLTSGYGGELDGRRAKIKKMIDTRDLSSATGFYSTASDLCKYFAHHFYGNDVLLKDKSKRTLHADNFQSGSGDAYGLGFVRYDKKGWKLCGHSGGFPGFITNSVFDPEKKLSVSVLTNCNGSNAKDISRAIIEIIDFFQNNMKAVKVTPARLKKYESRLYNLWCVYDIFAVGNKLFCNFPQSWNFSSDMVELKSNGTKKFIIDLKDGYGSPGEDMIFNFDGKGKVHSALYAGASCVSLAQARRNKWYV